jgi:hypothetical protein
MTKDEVKLASERWMAEIAELREKYPLFLVVMRDNAGENKSKELADYFTSRRVENYYSTAYEPWQDGLAEEAAVKSVMMLAKCGMAGSGLEGPYWFCAATNGKDCRNVIYKERIKDNPWGLLYKEMRKISRFRPFGCIFWMYLNKDQREKGKTAPSRGSYQPRFCFRPEHKRIRCSFQEQGRCLRQISWCLMRVSSRIGRRNSFRDRHSVQSFGAYPVAGV